MGTLLSYGAVLWDVIGDKRHIGGAPFNVAANLAAFGWNAYMLSRIGSDEAGRAAFAEVEKMGIKTDLLQFDPLHPTGTATVTFSAGSPEYKFCESPAYNYIEFTDAVQSKIGALDFDVFYFGTYEQQSANNRTALYGILESNSFKEVFFDVNIRQNFCPRDVLEKSLTHATIVKINEEEAAHICGALGAGDSSRGALAGFLAENFGVKILCVTMGKRGCEVYCDGKSKSFGEYPVRVVNTIGAGDGFSSAFIAKYTELGDPFLAGYFGNIMGSCVASFEGAVPQLTREMKEKLDMA